MGYLQIYQTNTMTYLHYNIVTLYLIHQATFDKQYLWSILLKEFCFSEIIYLANYSKIIIVRDIYIKS